MKEWMGHVMASPERLAIPIMTNPGIELCGRSILEAVTNGQVHYEAIKKLDEVYPANVSTAIMDLTVEAEAFGAEIRFSEDEIPTVVGRLLTDCQSVKNLEIPSLNSGRVQEYLKANRLTALNIDNKPVFGGCIGPFSLAGRLFDMTEMMMAMYTEPETVVLLLEKCTQFIINYCQAMKETGISGVVIAEPAAGLVSNEDCLLYSSNYIRKIVEDVQDEYFMVILHNCGNTGHCTEAMLAVGAMGYHFGNKADMLEVLEQCPFDVLVMGNLDPVGLMKMSTKEEVEQATMNILKATSSYPNYILSTGCDVPPNVPLENVAAFYKAFKEYNNAL